MGVKCYQQCKGYKEHWNCKNLLKFTYLNHKLIQMVPLKQEIIDFIDLGFVLYAVSAILENWPNIGKVTVHQYFARRVMCSSL